jgi:hypothetical protein
MHCYTNRPGKVTQWKAANACLGNEHIQDCDATQKHTIMQKLL